MGLYRSQPTEWLEKVKLTGLMQLDITQEEIEELIEQRLQARAEKNFSRGDDIRIELEEKGILLLDTREGTSWRLK